MSNQKKQPYISCIKINGKPILPPIITPESRKTLQIYKRQAIKLEQHLREVAELNTNNKIVKPKEDSRPCSQLTFGDNSHVEALGILDRVTDSTKKYSKASSLHPDVSEVLPNGLTKLPQYDNVCINPDKNQSVFSCNSESYTNLDIPKNFSNITNKPKTPDKPRLIRSNSYTLENPSPVLLAHLQKMSTDQVNDSGNLSTVEKLSLIDNNLPSFESSNCSSLNTIYFNDKSNEKDEQNELTSNLKESSEVTKPSTEDVYQTEISVQRITVKSGPDLVNVPTRETKSDFGVPKSLIDGVSIDNELLDVLKDIPEMYANQIMDLLKKQRLDDKHLENYEFNASVKKCFSSPELSQGPTVNNSQKSTYNDLKNEPFATPQKNVWTNGVASNEPPQEYEPNSQLKNNDMYTSLTVPYTEVSRSDSAFSMSPSQTLYYSASSDTDTLIAPESPSVKVIDLEIDEKEKEDNHENGIFQEEVTTVRKIKELRCSTELFPTLQQKPYAVDALKREWAASIIGAHVRGYLTRRLIKTDKMQGLIATIKDVLVCALELHYSDSIDEKDVEFHRRLINQLSAALFEFHEVFFDLSIPEQMSIIAQDRQRQLEKLKRPLSGRSSVGTLSSRSSVGPVSVSNSVGP